MSESGNGETVQEDFENDRLTENLTPEQFRCTIGNCPAVYRTATGKLLIIGKRPAATLDSELADIVGEDEWAVVVDPAMLVDAVQRD